jgi:hypothetical protein
MHVTIYIPHMYFVMLLYVCVNSDPSRNKINGYLAVLKQHNYFKVTIFL